MALSLASLSGIGDGVDRLGRPDLEASVFAALRQARSACVEGSWQRFLPRRVTVTRYRFSKEEGRETIHKFEFREYFFFILPGRWIFADSAGDMACLGYRPMDFSGEL